MLSNIFLNILHLLLLLTYIERCTKTCMRRTGVCTGVCAFKPKLAHNVCTFKPNFANKYVPLREALNHFCYFSVSCKVWWGLQVIQLIRQQSAKVPPQPNPPRRRRRRRRNVKGNQIHASLPPAQPHPSWLLRAPPTWCITRPIFPPRSEAN